MLSTLALSYGKSVDPHKPLFAIAPDFVLRPSFSADGLLIKLSIEPRSNVGPAYLSETQFELILADLNSLKPLGRYEEDRGAAVVLGGRASVSKRYQNAYLQTSEFITRRVTSAAIYYLHPVTGRATFSPDSNPNSVGSFGLLCIEGKSYIAPQTVYQRLWSNQSKAQTVDLAGPTGDKCD